MGACLFYDQSAFDIRCEWGLAGVRLVGGLADVVVIVDVLSFSTCVDVAVSRGAGIFPYRWKDQNAPEYAVQCGAELAGRRGEPGKFSLSCASMFNAVTGSKIVLPSPNGSALTMEAADLGRIVLSGCFRNCRAVAQYAQAHGKTIAVIPAGERWPDASLRPAAEDFAAAGAIIANLRGTASPEASVALATWNGIKNDLAAFLESCASGRELIERGFAEDVAIAAKLDTSATVPVLRQSAFVSADDQANA
jgi:2-phosphosulfolactate phosphatase